MMDFEASVAKLRAKVDTNDDGALLNLIDTHPCRGCTSVLVQPFRINSDSFGAYACFECSALDLQRI